MELEGRVRVTLQCTVTVAVQRGEEGGGIFWRRWVGFELQDLNSTLYGNKDETKRSEEGRGSRGEERSRLRLLNNTVFGNVSAIFSTYKTATNIRCAVTLILHKTLFSLQ